MGDILLKLLNMSLAAGWLIAAVIIFRLIARKTPRWIICLLWGLVAIRLICPFSMECSFSAVPSQEIIPESILSESCRTLHITTGVEPVDGLVNEYLGDTYHEGTSVAYDYGNILMSGLGTVWLCGVIGLLSCGMIRSLQLRRHLKEAVLLQEKVCLCDHVRSPLVFGVFRPRIYLPSDLDGADMEYVIAHEKAHLQRKDHIWKVMAFCLLTVYWFHPLSWAAFVLFCRDMELACDEKVIKNLSMSEKKAYSESLMSCSLKKRMAIVYPVTFGEVGVKQRVKSILNYKKPGFWAVSFSLLACIVMGICFLTTSPQEHQTMGTVPDASPTQIQRDRAATELKQMLLDYDKENIVEVAVALRNYGNEDAYANILIVGKDKASDGDELDGITSLASEYLGLDAYHINLIYEEYVDSKGMVLEASSMQIQRDRAAIELKQMLLDYDKDNIVEVEVALQNYDNEDAYANILLVGKDNIADVNELDGIMSLVSEYLDFDTYHINLIYEKYADSEAFSTANRKVGN